MNIARILTSLGFPHINPSSISTKGVYLNIRRVSAGQEVNTFTERTHTCGQLSNEHVGQRVNLFGWVKYARFNNKIIALRDSYGVMQCIVDANLLQETVRKLDIPNESVVNVTGIVRERPANQKNDKLPSGDIEILIDALNILSKARKDLPILARDAAVSQDNRLKNRYLDIRSKNMQQALRMRSKMCEILRNKLYSLDFIECETPTLFSRTPGGANEFIVPTKTPDKYYSLVQSPQQLKQMLMIGALDRYFQICRCYRDESGRSDRQPEFTQVDIELSFTNQAQVMKLIEELLYDLFIKIPCSSADKQAMIESFDEKQSIRRMNYQEAFEKYGTDKPDTRFDWIIKDDESSGITMKIPIKVPKEDISELADEIRVSDNRYEICDDDDGVQVRMPEKTDQARKFLGVVRTTLASRLTKKGLDIYKRRYSLLWVMNFPLFTVDERGNLEPNHHPFTAPTPDSLEMLTKNPSEVIGQHYDLVLNGQEVAGGSIRIHDPDLQRRIFTDILRVKEGTFDYFIEALSSGCPPHGGIAIGLDRIVASLLSRESIKDVIAFPKSSSGRDLMTNCPQEIDLDVKQMYHIK